MVVTVQDDGADDERLEALTSGLRRELSALDVDQVTRVREGELPAGARGIEVAAVGAMLVVLKQSADLVIGIVGAIRSWLVAAPPGRAVEISVGDKSLKVTSATAEQQEALISEFVEALQRVGTGSTDSSAAS